MKTVEESQFLVKSAWSRSHGPIALTPLKNRPEAAPIPPPPRLGPENSETTSDLREIRRPILVEERIRPRQESRPDGTRFRGFAVNKIVAPRFQDTPGLPTYYRVRMTTLTTTRPARNPIAWPSILWVGAFHVGALLAFVPGFFTWQALAVGVVMHWFPGGIGICLCYHRLLTHRSFATRPKFLEYVLAAIGCSASEGGPIGWVADHRRHHKHSDEELDVHTPHEGFLWAHMMWWATPDSDTEHTQDYYNRWAPDLNRDPVLRWLDRWHFIFPLFNLAVLFAIGGMPWLVWGGFVSTVIVLHTTWLVNSATHVWGYRTHKTHDDSTNNWWVALLTYGEGWHNNHHALPTSARHGLRWWELDMTYLAIRLMSVVGLAYAVKLPRSTATCGEPSQAIAKPKRRKAKKIRRSDEERELVGAVND